MVRMLELINPSHHCLPLLFICLLLHHRNNSSNSSYMAITEAKDCPVTLQQKLNCVNAKKDAHSARQVIPKPSRAGQHPDVLMRAH